MNSLKLTNVNMNKSDNVGFSFSDYGGVHLYLEPKNSFMDSGKTIRCSNNTSCYTLQDVSGNPFDFTQPLATNRPIFKTGGRNGNPYLEFNIGSIGNYFLVGSNRNALRCLHNGLGGSIYIVAEIPIATVNFDVAPIICSNGLLATNDGFSIPTDYYVDPNLRTRFEITNGVSVVGQTDLYVNNNEFRVIAIRTSSSVTPNIAMQADAEFGYSPVDSFDILNTANYTGTLNDAPSGADITIGEIGVDTGHYCIMNLYLIVAYNEYVSNESHQKILNHLKMRFNIPQYEII